MRVLSLSHRIQNRFVDNHTIFNAPNLVDYDAIVFDALGVFESVRAAAEGRGEFVTHTQVPVVNGDSVDASAGLAELLQRRREEMQRALERGSLLIVYTAPVTRFGGINGLQGFDRYFLVPAPDGMSWDANTIRGGEGATGAVVDYDHPFVRVVETYRRQLLYRAYFNDRAPGVAKHGHTFMRSSGGAPIGIEFRVHQGRVVFLPTPREAGTQALATPEGQALISAVADTLGLGTDDDRPRWATSYPIPGLGAREAAVTRAEEEVARANEALEAARERMREAAIIRDLLWIGHDLGVRRSAVRCAELIGFEVEEDEDGHVVLKDGRTRVHTVAATATEAVGMSAHYRLRSRVDAVIEQRARAERGVIVANGQRLTRPEERKREVENSVRVAAESVGYAILPAQTLFHAVVAALEGASVETLAAIRSRIASTNGVVVIDDLIGEVPEPEPGAEDDTEGAASDDAASDGSAGDPQDPAAGEPVEAGEQRSDETEEADEA